MVLAILILLSAAVSAQTANAEPLRVQLLWHHQAQFTGIYVAEAKGFYDEAGLEVEIIQGGPGINPIEELGNGFADVALAWLPPAMTARGRGHEVVNIAQVFQTPGLAIVCRRDAGIRRIEDVAGKTIGVWYMGDEVTVSHWLSGLGLSLSDVTLAAQGPNGRDLSSGLVDCATAMMYNEYWSILAAGHTASDLIVFRIAQEGLALMEDGFYATREGLEDPVRRDALARFIGATMSGWAYAKDNVDESFAIAMARSGQLDADHQRRMLETTLRLVGSSDRVGLIDIAAFDRSIDMLAAELGQHWLRQASLGAWTQKLWYESGRGHDSLLSISDATRHRMKGITTTWWFLGFVLTGAVVFSFAGFMRAQQREYDLWGSFILTLLPAAGGGTIRDLVVGGDRYPPFIIQDPIYIYVVFAAFLGGIVMSRLIDDRTIASRGFDSTMKFLDTLGFAAFAVVGAKVAIVAGLSWIWVPICAAITCAGGGMLSDVITGREPRTFKGEPYEELAIIGGLLMLLGLQLADTYEHVPWITGAVMAATLVFVFLLRCAVVVTGFRFRPLARLKPMPEPATMISISMGPDDSRASASIPAPEKPKVEASM